MGPTLFFLIMALLVGGWALLSVQGWRKTEEEKPEQSHIDQVREAAFAVIEASLEAEPEKWETQLDSRRVKWTVNRDAGIALYLGAGPGGLFVIDRRQITPTGQALFTNDLDKKFDPPKHIAMRLYTKAMAIGSVWHEKIEIAQLSNMVAAFGQIVDRRKNNDQKAA